MDGSIDAHRRYLVALRDACATSPALHEHQLAALESELELAAGEDLAAALAASGGLFELARAERLDRLAGEARVGTATGDPWRARAAAGGYRHALAATGHADWGAGADEAEAIITAGADATAAFTRLVLALPARERALAELGALRAADPGFRLDRPPYALRLPWAGEPISGWIAELEREAGGQPLAADDGGDPLAEIAAGGAAWRAGLGAPRAAAGGEPFVLGDPAAGYRAMAAVAPGDDPVAMATRDAAAALVAAADAAASPQEALIAFVADGLLARLAAAGLRARAEAALARQTFWPDPLTERHWRGLRDDLDRARTPTEVHLVAFHATACLAVESDWNLIRHGVLTTPLVAALAHDLEPDPVRARDVRRAATASHALTGLGPRAALAHPVVAGLLGRDPHGTEEGEAGYDLVSAARTWSEVTGEAADAAALERVLDRAGAPEPPAAERPVTRWGGPDGKRPPLPRSLP